MRIAGAYIARHNVSWKTEIEPYTGTQLSFCVRTFYENNEAVITARLLYQKEHSLQGIIDRNHQYDTQMDLSNQLGCSIRKRCCRAIHFRRPKKAHTDGENLVPAWQEFHGATSPHGYGSNKTVQHVIPIGCL